MSYLKWLGAGLFSLAIAVAAAEFGLRLYYYGSLAPFVGGAHLYKPDPQIGFIPNPGTRSSFQRAAYIVPVNINSLGMRGPELTPKNGKFRIALSGDGHVFGSGLTDQETLPAQLQKALSETSGHLKVDVVNAAGPSYNTVQQLLRLRTLLPKIHADLLVLAFNSENDIHYNVNALRKYMISNPKRPTATLTPAGDLVFDFSSAQKYFEQRKKRLLDPGAPQPWYLNTAIYVRGRVWWRARLAQPAPDPNIFLGLPHLAAFSDEHSPYGLSSSAYNELWQEGWSVTKALILAIRAEALRHGTEFALTVLPSDVQVDRKTLAGTKSQFPRLNLDLTRINRLMGEFASREGIPILETLAPLLDARDSGQMDLHYTIFDSHMTPKSHRILAKALAEQLQIRGLIRAQK